MKIQVKRALCLCLLAAFLLCATAVLPLAASAKDPYALTLEVACVTARTESGAAVAVPVSITESSGYLAGVLTVHWDPGALTLEAVEYSTLGPDDGSPAIDEEDRAAGSYRLAVGDRHAPATGGNIEGTGVLFTLCFKVVDGAADGVYAVTVSDEQFVDYHIAAPDIRVTVQQGSVTLASATPTEPPTSDDPSAPVTTDGPTEPATDEPTVEPTDEPTGTPTDPVSAGYLLGDADGDGDVTILDATCIQRMLAKLPVAETYNENAAKVAGEDLSILDATYIQRWLAKLSVDYPIGEWIA